MFTLQDSLLQHIQNLPISDRVKLYMPEIYIHVMRLFIGKPNKSPIEILANDLINSFLHTYVGPLVQKELGFSRSKQDVLFYVQKQVEPMKNRYIQIWNKFENLVSQYDKDKQFAIVMFQLLKQPVLEERQQAIIKIKILALISLVRFFHPKGQDELHRIQECWVYLFGVKFPTQKKCEKCRKEILEYEEKQKIEDDDEELEEVNSIKKNGKLEEDDEEQKLLTHKALDEHINILQIQQNHQNVKEELISKVSTASTMASESLINQLNSFQQGNLNFEVKIEDEQQVKVETEINQQNEIQNIFLPAAYVDKQSNNTKVVGQRLKRKYTKRNQGLKESTKYEEN